MSAFDDEDEVPDMDKCSLIWQDDYVCCGPLVIEVIHAYNYLLSKNNATSNKIHTIINEEQKIREINWDFVMENFTVNDFMNAYNELI